MSIINRLQQFSTCIEIAHHIPGRIRMRLLLDELPALDTPAESLVARARDFKDTLENIPGIRSIRVNALARARSNMTTGPFRFRPGRISSPVCAVTHPLYWGGLSRSLTQRPAVFDRSGAISHTQAVLLTDPAAGLALACVPKKENPSKRKEG